MLGLCMLMLWNINAQRFPFTTINVKDGLPQSSVFKIVQDKQGYIWMATEAGLCRYDGYKFITYSIHNGLGSKFISDIKFDDEGRLWISTMGRGISWFDGKKFHRFDKSNGLPSNQVRSLEFTNNGELLISTLDTGIVRLSKNRKPEIYYLPDGSDFANPWKMTRLRNGDIISTGVQGAYRFVAAKNYSYELIYDAPQTLINSFEAENGDLWIAGIEQLIQIKNGTIIDRSDLLSSLDGQPAGAWDVFEPRNQPDLYISTSKGLMILKDSTVKWLTVANGLPYEHIMDTYQDCYGNFWVGSYGGGAAILDSKGLDHFDFSDEVIPLSTAAIIDDEQGNIWLSSDNYGIFMYDGKTIQHNPDPRLQSGLLALAMGVNPVNKEIWIGSLFGQIAKLKDKKVVFFRTPTHGERLPILHMSFLSDGTGVFCTQIGAFKLGLHDQDPVWLNELPSVYFRSSFVDHQGYIWFMGDEGELYRWKDGKAVNFTSIINPDLNGLDQGLYDPFHNMYWFCSSAGLIVWNGQGTYLFHSGNGLKSDSPWSITQDSTGRIWVGHEKGVECIDVDKKKITFIGYDQGFTPVETNSCVAMTDHKGDVWFGTISSASRVRTHDLKADDRTGVLRVQKVFEGKKLVYEELYNDTACPPLTFNYNQNTFNIEMAALCYSNSRDVRYSWFLENYDEEWIVDNEHREALYTNVPPGDYTFHAKAVEPNGFETNEVVIHITILRPFWHRPWFYITEFSILGLFIFLSFRFSSNPHQNKLGSFVTLLTILIIFESLLLYLSTYINKFTGDVPVFQLVMNVVLAATLNPLEHLIQNIMRNWALKRLRRKNKTIPPTPEH
jgi:ligand-binding sensor domain-containing protein